MEVAKGAALASPMSWTSSDVVHQPVTPKAGVFVDGSCPLLPVR